MNRFLFYLVLFPISVAAQHNLTDSIELIIERESTASPHVDTSLSWLGEALRMSQEINYAEGQFKSLDGLGAAYLRSDQYETALKYFHQAEAMAVSLDSMGYLGRTHLRFGSTYYDLRRFEKAAEHYQKALDILEPLGSTIAITHAFNGLGLVHVAKQDDEKALHFFKKSYRLADSIGLDNLKVYPITNISYLYLKKKQASVAMPYIEESIQINSKFNDFKRMAAAYGNLGYAHHLMGNHEAAFRNYQTCLDTALKHNFHRIAYFTYKDMSETYEEIGSYPKALDFLKKFHTLKDSVSGVSTQQRIAELEVRYKTERKDREIIEKQANITRLKQQQIIDRQRTYLLTYGIILLLALAFGFYFKMRADFKRKKELHTLEQQLLSNKLKMQEIEKQKMEDDLTYKNKRLTSFALDISRKNTFFEKLMDGLTTLEKSSSEQIPKKVKELKLLTSTNLQIHEDLTALQKDVEAINFDFYRELEEKYPQLTPNDKVLCGLIRLNLTNKEIAVIRKVSEKAIKMARYRIRKKFELQPDDDIVEFLKGIGANIARSSK